MLHPCLERDPQQRRRGLAVGRKLGQALDELPGQDQRPAPCAFEIDPLEPGGDGGIGRRDEDCRRPEPAEGPPRNRQQPRREHHQRIVGAHRPKKAVAVADSLKARAGPFREMAQRERFGAGSVAQRDDPLAPGGEGKLELAPSERLAGDAQGIAARIARLAGQRNERGAHSETPIPGTRGMS